ncbi:MAG: cupin domain-containing protein [Mycobacterium sp.]
MDGGSLHSGGRPAGTAILFLITDNDFSVLHKLKIDEMWNFHAGDPAELATIDPSTGALHVHILGSDLLSGNAPQVVVRAGQWQGARLRPGANKGHGWALFGCTMVPGWQDDECELGDRETLTRDFPAHCDWINALTR